MKAESCIYEMKKISLPFVYKTRWRKLAVEILGRRIGLLNLRFSSSVCQWPGANLLYFGGRQCLRFPLSKQIEFCENCVVAKINCRSVFSCRVFQSINNSDTSSGNDTMQSSAVELCMAVIFSNISLRTLPQIW